MRAAAALPLLLAALAAHGPVMAAEPASMADAAKGFLTVYGGFHPSDGIPDAAGRARFAPYVSPRLMRLLADGDAAEARFAAKLKDSPPLIEGDLFTSMFEGATGWTLGKCVEDAKVGDIRTGHCPVAFVHADPGRKPVEWTDTLILSAAGSGWRVDDVAYGGGFAFGNTGRLSQTLMTVLKQTD